MARPSSTLSSACDVVCDVCIVGGGIGGTALARYLQMGLPATERERVRLFDKDLTDGMGARAGVISYCGMGRSVRVGLFHGLKQLLGTLYALFCQSWDLNNPRFILHDVEHVLIIEQIETASSVYFEIADYEGELFGNLEEFGYSLFLQSIHGVGFT